MTQNSTEQTLSTAPLGKKSAYQNVYDRSLLFPVPRKLKRDEIGIIDKLPFRGFDIWNGFELSWLNSKGKPIVAVAEFIIPCESPNLIESKSFKLYLNSFNNSRFESFEQVRSIMTEDLSACAGAPIMVRLFSITEASHTIGKPDGLCLDDLDIECTKYMPDSGYLKTEDQWAEETLYTHLLKSNCLVTGQPDWGTIQISYSGKKINSEGLLQYIVSLRDHNEFHEQCVERIFLDIQKICQPQSLTVYARYTRRGGLDINPYRTTQENLKAPPNLRLVRQ
jgi:7-cyano-7-deazaguanine reductase